MNKLKLFLCFVFGHSYYVVKKYSRDSRKVGCYCCDKYWGMNDPSKAFLPWDDELEELHEGSGLPTRKELSPPREGGYLLHPSFVKLFPGGVDEIAKKLKTDPKNIQVIMDYSGD